MGLISGYKTELLEIADGIENNDPSVNKRLKNTLAEFKEEPVSKQGGEPIKLWYWKNSSVPFPVASANLLFDPHGLRTIIENVKIEVLLMQTQSLRDKKYSKRDQLLIEAEIRYLSPTLKRHITAIGSATMPTEQWCKELQLIAQTLIRYQNAALLRAVVSLANKIELALKEQGYETVGDL